MLERPGNSVVLVGARAGLVEALERIGATGPDAIVPDTAAELREFLTANETTRSSTR